MSEMELVNKEIRGINLKMLIAWITGIITVCVLGASWYYGITNGLEQNKRATDELRLELREEHSFRITQWKEFAQKQDAQQMQLDKLTWEWQNFKDYYDINPKPRP